MNYKILVTTSNKYLPALRPMMHLLKQYWHPLPQVIIGGFKEPEFDLLDGFTFHSIGDQKDYPVGKWSDGIRKLVSETGGDVFITLLEDMWPIRMVDTHAVQILVDYMHQFEYVSRIDLTGDRLYAHGMRHYGYVSYLDLIQSMPGSPYHLSFMAGIWRKKHFMQCIKPNWSPWDCEIQGTPVLSYMNDVIVLGTRQWPVRHTLALRGGEHSKLLLDELQEADVKELKSLGYLEHWGIK